MSTDMFSTVSTWFFSSVIHPDDLKRIQEENAGALEKVNKNIDDKERLVQPFQYRVKNKNGDWRWLKTYGAVFSRDDKNQVETVLNISVDITERKAAEKELYSKNEIIEGILNNLPVIATKVNNKGIITESIGVGLGALDMKQNEAVGINILDGFPHNTKYTSELLVGKPANFVSITDHPKGKRYHQNYFFPDRNNEGFIGFSLDITAQKEAENKLIESQRFIEKIAEIAPFPIAVMDYVNQQPIYVNFESLRILGYSDEEIKERKAEELIATSVHPDDIDKIKARQKIIPRLKDEDVDSLEYRIKDRYGNWVWLSSKIKVFKRNEAGRTEQYISVAADVTVRKLQEMEIDEKNKELSALLEELKTAEEQLIEANNDLEKRVNRRTQQLAVSEQELKNALEKSVELNKEIVVKNRELTRINNDLDSFIYTASHDLKAPISNMEGLVYSMERNFKGRIQEQDKKLFNMMTVSIERLKSTINSLTDISKISKNLDEQVEPLSFKEILEDVKADVYQSFKDVNTTITEELQIQSVNFVKPNLRSITLNLLSNAFKYRSFDRPLEVKIRTYKDEEYIVFSIEDNGLGIKEEHKEKLFKLFRRLHSHVEGSGVGLYLIKRIIENAGGKIEVESKENVCTIFKIYFPLKK